MDYSATERFLRHDSARRSEIEEYAKKIIEAGWDYDQLVWYAATLEWQARNFARAKRAADDELKELYLPISIFGIFGDHHSAEEKAELLDELAQKGNPVAHFAKNVLSSNATKGGRARAEARQSTREYCRKLYQEQPAEAKHQTRLKAIRERVIAFDTSQITSNERKPLSFDQFIKTAGAWCNDLRP